AAVAEAALGAGAGGVPLQAALRVVQADPFLPEASPGDHAGAVRAPAHRAMAMRHPLAGQSGFETQVAAEAASAGCAHGRVLPPPILAQARAGAAVEQAVADGLGDVGAADVFGAFQVGQGAGDALDAVHGAGGE